VNDCKKHQEEIESDENNSRPETVSNAAISANTTAFSLTLYDKLISPISAGK
jgi:hypothetical protein